MLAQAELRKDLILVGGGHSHALAIRLWAMNPVAGVRVTLISPASHTPYSGRLPGLVAGHYSFSEAHIDLARLCQWAGVRFICARVVGLDPQLRRLSLVGRPDINYDVVSVDIGSEPELDSVPGARQYSVPVKPVAQLWRRWGELEQQLAAQPTQSELRIGIVGGGAGSVELALAMAQRLSVRFSQPKKLALYCGAAEILTGYNAKARRAVVAALSSSGIALHLNARVVQVEERALVLANGTRAQHDLLFWCTGASAAPWIASSGLPTDEHGFLAVNAQLQSSGDAQVFAAGDIATQLHDPRPKAGVYAVRQAPVLVHNLRASLLGESLRPYRPQRKFLSLLSLGEKRASAERGRFSATGAWVWRWKNRIDEEFMQRFNVLEEMPKSAATPLPELVTQDQQVCGGCGAKVGGDALAGALAQLRLLYPQHLANTEDDAVQIPIPIHTSVTVTTTPILQSIDVLREIVSDPWVMGKIAANHALSDLYACGLKPVSALAAVTLPFASSALLQRELYQLLAGALAQFETINCELAGGHSMQGAELQLGFVVNGIAMRDDGAVLPKRGVASGDALVLTKPLGTGVLFAAHMQLQGDGRDIQAATDVMLVSNYDAAQLALEHGATACTDVTGFGLAGHLLEMLGGEFGASLQLARMPLLDGATQALHDGITSTMHSNNVAAYADAVNTHDDADLVRASIVFDPQTSGGLLIAVPSEKANALCTALQARGYSEAAVIGVVTAIEGTTILELV